MTDKTTIKAHPGYFGVFTTEQAPGAIPNGSRVKKVKCEPVDIHPIGELATVLGSIQNLSDPTAELAYFVEWDASPKAAVLVVGWKIGPAEQ